MFADVPEKKHTLLALFTDGEDFVSNADELQQQVKDTGLRPFTIGVGSSEGAPIPCFDLHGNKSGFKRDRNGEVVITRCNEELAKQFSESCGGVYISGKDDDRDIHRLQEWVALFEKERYGDTSMKQFQEKYYYFAGIAWVLLLLEWLI
jgi:Ca-activated chloride channel family protein